MGSVGVSRGRIREVRASGGQKRSPRSPDELAAIEDEIADAAFLGTPQDRLASAKARAATALAPLRQWLKEAEANDEGEAGE